MKVLTTPSDLVNFGGLPKDFPKCDLRHIKGVEKDIFRECIGEELYDKLKEACAEYPCKDWVKGIEAQEGEVFIYKGVFKIALKDTTEPPHNKECWGNAPKFNIPCLEDLWCEVLGEYLAHAIIIPSLPLMLSQIKDGSIVRVGGRNVEKGNKEDLKCLKEAFITFRDIAFRNLVAYIQDNNEDGCFDGFKHCNKPCAKKKRRKKKGGVRFG